MGENEIVRQAIQHVKEGRMFEAGRILEQTSDPGLKMISTISQSMIMPSESDRRKMLDLLNLHR